MDFNLDLAAQYVAPLPALKRGIKTQIYAAVGPFIFSRCVRIGLC
jgi:hypothetical protein